MKLISQAIRAVVVETLGVVLVLWLLFGTAVWTLEGPDGGRGPTLGDDLALRSYLVSWSEQATDWFRSEPERPPSSQLLSSL